MTRAATLDLLTRREPRGAATSYDTESRSFRARISSFADVRRFGWIERFPRTRGDWIFERVDSPAGVPLLDNHGQFSASSRLGRVTRMWHQPDGIWIEARLNRSEAAEAIARDMQDGLGVALSFGYEVAVWDREAPARPGDPEVRVARGITPVEVSVVNIAADPGAHARSYRSSRNRNMDDDDILAEIEGHADRQPAPQQRAEGAQHQRSASAEPPQQHQAPAEPEPRRRFTMEDRRVIAEVAGLGEDFVRRHARTGEAAYRRAAVTAATERERRNPIFPHIAVGAEGGYDDPASLRRAMGEALYTRLNPTHQPSDMARPFVNHRLLDLARSSLEARGERVMGLSASEIVTRSFASGAHTGSDFSLMLADATGRVLRERYEAAATPLRALGRRVDFPDFRTRKALQLSEGPNLARVNENGEIRGGTIEEGQEAWRGFTYARRFDITREIVINDDVGMLERIPGALAIGAANTEADLLAALVISNPPLSDSNPVFDGAHGNLGSAAFLSVSALSAARVAMRNSRGLAGERINVVPRFLLVGPEMETRAEQLLAELRASEVDNVNPFASRLSLAVEPRIEDHSWYLVDPALGALEWGYLMGAPGPQTETQQSFDRLGVSIRIVLDFGAGWVDHRGWHKNPGAEPPTE